MKSILSWFELIVSIAVLVSSCAKSDDSKTASTSSADNTTSSSDDSSDNSSLPQVQGYSWQLVLKEQS